MRIEKWNVDAVQPARGEGRFRGDGDTVWLTRSRIERLGDEDFLVADVEPKSHRLVWLDTPERGEEDYASADADLDQWISMAIALGPIYAYVYDGGAGWDRKLCDLVNTNGQSASQYMMIEKGWPAYVAGS